MDRYIPRWAHRSPYRLTQGSLTSEPESDTVDTTLDSDSIEHSIIIANSLGLTHVENTHCEFSHSSIDSDHKNYDRILQYLPQDGSPLGKNAAVCSALLQSNTNILNQSPFESPKRSILMRNYNIPSLVPFRILDAPCLRNDFYSNLISWSNYNSMNNSFTNVDNNNENNNSNVIVGLNRSVYMWSHGLGAMPILNNNYLSNANDYITCVSTIIDNSALLVGTKLGKLLLFDQRKITINKPIFKFNLFSKRSTTCITWFNHYHDIFSNLFICGDEIGNLSIFKFSNNKIFLLHCFHSQEQQICGK